MPFEKVKRLLTNNYYGIQIAGYGLIVVGLGLLLTDLLGSLWPMFGMAVILYGMLHYYNNAYNYDAVRGYKERHQSKKAYIRPKINRHRGKELTGVRNWRS